MVNDKSLKSKGRAAKLKAALFLLDLFADIL